MSGLGSRRVRLAAGLGGVMLAVAACGAAPERDGGGDLEGKFPAAIELADNTDPNAEFTYGYTVMTSTWDPVQSASGYEYVTLAPVYDRLVYGAEDGSLEPMLATEWESADDGKAIVLTLREGVTFSDGTPFNAEAVKINLDRAMGEGSRIAPEVAMLDAVEVIDEYTVKLIADTGAGALLGALAQRPGMMASPAAIAAGTLTQQPVGAGAYTLTDSAPGDFATYTKRDGYWDPDAQKVASMTIQLMVDDQTRFNALQAGEIDGANIRAFQASAAENAGVQIVSAPTVAFQYLNLNTSMAPLNDPKVLQALNLALDRESIGEGFYEGLCTPQIQPWPPNSFAYSEEIGDGLDVWPHDPEKARQLLEEAGYPNGFDLPAVTTNVSVYIQLSEVVQAQLAEIGVTMSINPVPTAQVREEFSLKKSVAANINPYSGVVDPNGFASLFLMENSVLKPGEPTNPATLDLAIQASTPIAPEDRAPLYHELMQSMIDNPTHVLPICAAHVIEAFQDDVSGFAVNLSGYTELRGIAKTEQ